MIKKRHLDWVRAQNGPPKIWPCKYWNLKINRFRPVHTAQGRFHITGFSLGFQRRGDIFFVREFSYNEGKKGSKKRNEVPPPKFFAFSGSKCPNLQYFDRGDFFGGEHFFTDRGIYFILFLFYFFFFFGGGTRNLESPHHSLGFIRWQWRMKRLKKMTHLRDLAQVHYF